jgi:hypothetical protein
VVTEVIGRALAVRRPRTRYLVGRDAIYAATMAKFVPDRVMDRLLLSSPDPRNDWACVRRDR